jgi:hypothetical protein
MQRMSRQPPTRKVPHDVTRSLDRVDPPARLEALRRYVTWSEEDLREFSEALAEQRSIDADVWR